MAWWTKSGWKRSWNTRAWRKKAARVASRRADREEVMARAIDYQVEHEEEDDNDGWHRPRPLP